MLNIFHAQLSFIVPAFVQLILTPQGFLRKLPITSRCGLWVWIMRLLWDQFGSHYMFGVLLICGAVMVLNQRFVCRDSIRGLLLLLLSRDTDALLQLLKLHRTAFDSSQP